ncbi:chromodomain-helicase-DNA-binding protein 3 [Caerostris extrusa]|uniref:Chromodomain-helicase-DNA-binding protein 3 n=1 Tax=Caerostris extrusa TaxID=172846 RepID=A0AAV4Y1H0_CAEEX|nr:chromodomain-helicase-DNA-binding protein 3 [Caerostris extrusa]
MKCYVLCCFQEKVYLFCALFQGSTYPTYNQRNEFSTAQNLLSQTLTAADSHFSAGSQALGQHAMPMQTNSVSKGKACDKDIDFDQSDAKSRFVLVPVYIFVSRWEGAFLLSGALPEGFPCTIYTYIHIYTYNKTLSSDVDGTQGDWRMSRRQFLLFYLRTRSRGVLAESAVRTQAAILDLRIILLHSILNSESNLLTSKLNKFFCVALVKKFKRFHIY